VAYGTACTGKYLSIPLTSQPTEALTACIDRDSTLDWFSAHDGDCAFAGAVCTTAADPFVTLADMLPGQSASGVQAHGFSCYSEAYDYRSTELHCFIDLPTGAFVRIGLFISQAWMIHSAAFTMRGNAIRLGDLMLILGKPQLHRYGRQIIFEWPTRGVTASAFADRSPISPFLPLWSMSFTLLSASG
jgi:hypothetical protein